MKLIATSHVGNYPLKIYESVEAKSYEAHGVTAKTEDGCEIQIYIAPDLPPAIYWETFWHELWHAFSIAYGLELGHEVVYIGGIGFAQLLGQMRWRDRPAQDMPQGLQPRAQVRAKAKKRRKK